MPNSTYRIESLSIEGFKAFTNQQTFHFKGRHAFLFGPNGLGKTSIVEAIRWCLFGLAARPGEIVRNQFYPGPCIVQMALTADDGQWTMQRRLRSSGTGTAPATVRDPNGSDRNVEDVFPQLSRIGPKEGTHVIYAAQQPSNRRPEANITDFSYVVYRYLGLEEVPRLSDVLLALDKAWESQEKEISDEVGELGEKFSERIRGVDENLSGITSNPPWGTGITPTAPDTRDKIDDMAREASALGAPLSDKKLEGLAPHDKLYEIDTAINSLLSGKLTDLKKKLHERRKLSQSAKSQLEDWQSAIDLMQEQSTSRDSMKDELNSVLNGSSIDDLQRQMQSAEADFESNQLKLDVVRSSLKYLQALGDEKPHNVCPACEGHIQRGELKSQLEGSESSSDTAQLAVFEQREQLWKRLSTAKPLYERIEEVDTDIARLKSDSTGILARAAQTFKLSLPPSGESLRKYVEEAYKDYENLTDVLEEQSNALKTWESRISNAGQEVRFHELRALKGRLRRLYDVRYEALHNSLKDLAGLRDIVDNIRNQLNSLLGQKLDSDLPPVAREMTDVYLRLTGNPTFNSISIQQGENADGSLTLGLRVSSSRGPGTWGVEQGVLNGQALNAIQLVPYFVFSRYQAEPLLDLLLLDDPTQAFDTSKINLLLTELADAASHATLFLATHEEERFLPVLKNFFDPNDVTAYKAVGIDEKGPHFEDVRISL